MPQTDYSLISTKPYFEGQVATSVACVRSSAVNLTGAVIPFGRMLIWNPANTRFEIPSATGQDIRGITTWSSIYKNNFDSNGDGSYPLNSEFDYTRQGEIAVFVEDTITQLNQPVYFRHTADGGNTVLGRFAGAAGTGLDLVNAAVATWQSLTTAPGQIARLAIKFP